MDNLFDVILQGIKDSFPKLNWKLGSVIRTLLVDPLTEIGEEVSSYVDAATENLDIEAVVNDPVGKDEALDMWMTRLGIAIPEATPSSGTLAILRSDNEKMTIPAGMSFGWGDDIIVYASERTEWNPTDYKQIAEGVYLAEIGVTTDVGSAISIGANEPMNWTNAPDAVTDVYVSSPICGGHDNSAQEKADLIRATLTSPGTFGAESIKSALVRKYGNVIADASLGYRTTVKGINQVPVFIKQSAEPAKLDREVTPVLSSSGDLVLKVDTSAVVRILGVWTANGVEVTPKTTIQAGELGSTGSFCTITLDNPGILLKYRVSLVQYSEAKAAIDWLNGTQTCLPFQMAAKLPVYCSIHLNLNVGGEDISSAAKADICGYINQSKLGGTLSSANIQTILSSYNYTLRAPVTFVGTVTTESGTTDSSTQVGSFVYTGQFNTAPVAMYCSVENIVTY